YKCDFLPHLKTDSKSLPVARLSLLWHDRFVPPATFRKSLNERKSGKTTPSNKSYEIRCDNEKLNSLLHTEESQSSLHATFEKTDVEKAEHESMEKMVCEENSSVRAHVSTTDTPGDSSDSMIANTSRSALNSPTHLARNFACLKIHPQRYPVETLHLCCSSPMSRSSHSVSKEDKKLTKPSSIQYGRWTAAAAARRLCKSSPELSDFFLNRSFHNIPSLNGSQSTVKEKRSKLEVVSPRFHDFDLPMIFTSYRQQGKNPTQGSYMCKDEIQPSSKLRELNKPTRLEAPYSSLHDLRRDKAKARISSMDVEVSENEIFKRRSRSAARQDKQEKQSFKSAAKSRNHKKAIEPPKLVDFTGDNVASVLRRQSTRRKEELNRRQTAERRRAEAEKKERTRLLRRTSPIWSQLAVANDSNSYQERKRAKILAERERQMMYNAAMNDMLSRVWQQPPLFARKST
ncbi:hypothetical protein QYM36_014969, partial [Artemia franciscana]